MSQLPANPAGGFGCNAAETQQSTFTAGGERTHSQLDEKSVTHFVTAGKKRYALHRKPRLLTHTALCCTCLIFI